MTLPDGRSGGSCTTHSRGCAPSRRPAGGSWTREYDAIGAVTATWTRPVSAPRPTGSAPTHHGREFRIRGRQRPHRCAGSAGQRPAERRVRHRDRARRGWSDRRVARRGGRADPLRARFRGSRRRRHHTRWSDDDVHLRPVRTTGDGHGSARRSDVTPLRRRRTGRRAHGMRTATSSAPSTTQSVGSPPSTCRPSGSSGTATTGRGAWSRHVTAVRSPLVPVRRCGAAGRGDQRPRRGDALRVRRSRAARPHHRSARSSHDADLHRARQGRQLDGSPRPDDERDVRRCRSPGLPDGA